MSQCSSEMQNHMASLASTAPSFIWRTLELLCRPSKSGVNLMCSSVIYVRADRNANRDHHSTKTNVAAAVHSNKCSVLKNLWSESAGKRLGGKGKKKQNGLEAVNGKSCRFKCCRTNLFQWDGNSAVWLCMIYPDRAGFVHTSPAAQPLTTSLFQQVLEECSSC